MRTMAPGTIATLVTGACVALIACSSSSGASSGLNVDPTKLLVALSPGDQAMVCDWIAAEFGGYGHTVTCASDGGTATLGAPTDQATCVGQFSSMNRLTPNCGVTVGQYAACTMSQAACGAGADAATDADCSAVNAPSCIPGSGGATDAGPE